MLEKSIHRSKYEDVVFALTLIQGLSKKNKEKNLKQIFFSHPILFIRFCILLKSLAFSMANAAVCAKDSSSSTDSLI